MGLARNLDNKTSSRIDSHKKTLPTWQTHIKIPTNIWTKRPMHKTVIDLDEINNTTQLLQQSTEKCSTFRGDINIDLPVKNGRCCKNVIIQHSTDSITLSTTREATSCWSIQEIPSILCNPKVHYRIHKSPPLAPIVSQTNPIHTTPSCLSKTHLNNIHPPTSLSS
jgi:hypothetical protein